LELEISRASSNCENVIVFSDKTRRIFLRAGCFRELNIVEYMVSSESDMTAPCLLLMYLRLMKLCSEKGKSTKRIPVDEEEIL
jgi:hypothetical protein